MKIYKVFNKIYGLQKVLLDDYDYENLIKGKELREKCW